MKVFTRQFTGGNSQDVLLEYENRFEREYGYFRPVVQEVVEKYLDCGNPKNGFARIRCSDCGASQLLMFSCKSRGFCPSCHAKRREEWGEWMRETLLLDFSHRQVVFTIPKIHIVQQELLMATEERMEYL